MRAINFNVSYTFFGLRALIFDMCIPCGMSFSKITKTYELDLWPTFESLLLLYCKLPTFWEHLTLSLLVATFVVC